MSRTIGAMAKTPDVTFDDRHELDPERAYNRESLVWVLTLPEEQLGGLAYTWVDARGAAGAAAVAFGPHLDEPVFERVDGVPVEASRSFADWRVAGMAITHDGPRRNAHIAYEGQRMHLKMDFTPVGVAYRYSSHADPFPSYFADERLEQGGTARGTLVLDGRDIAFEAFCHRDHSWGARDWGSALHYKWLNFLAPDTSVHVMDLQGLGRSDIRGYVHKNGETAEIVAAAFDYDLDADFVHRRLAVELRDTSSRTTRAAVREATADIIYPIDPRMTLIDVVGPAEIDGGDAAAYVEMAWPPEYLAHGVPVRRGADMRHA
jgi:hypothetical protein